MVNNYSHSLKRAGLYALASVLGLVIGLSPALASGHEAHICTSAGVPPSADQPLSDQTVFSCSGIGKLTVPQLAKAGWQLSDLVEQGSTPDGLVYWQVLIQR